MEAVSARGLRRQAPPGQLDAEGRHQDEHALRRYSVQSVSKPRRGFFFENRISLSALSQFDSWGTLGKQSWGAVETLLMKKQPNNRIQGGERQF